MDARRFDGFSKAWSAGTSRRRLLKAFPAVALGSTIPLGVRADAGPEIIVPAGGATDGTVTGTTTGGAATGATTTGAPTTDGATSGATTGGTTTGGTTTGASGTTTGGTTTGAGGTTMVEVTPAAGSAAPPAVSTQTETPAAGIGAQISPSQVLPARIYSGLCGQLGAEPAFDLIDLGAPGAQGTATPASTTPVGAASAVPVRASTSIVDALLGDLTAANYAIDVRLDAADPETSVVCGDVGGILGGQAPGTELAIGLIQANNSGYTGIAWLQDEGEQTVVNLFIAAGLADGGVGAATTPATETAPAATPVAAAETDTADDAAATTDGVAQGSRVVTLADVNLRAAPSLDAAIIAILGPGVELEVTGAVADGWVPVLEVSTGRRGYVTDAFVEPQAAA